MEEAPFWVASHTIWDSKALGENPALMKHNCEGDGLSTGMDTVPLSPGDSVAEIACTGRCSTAALCVGYNERQQCFEVASPCPTQ